MAAAAMETQFCPACNNEFGILRWRHSCRRCRREFCDDCTPHRYSIDRANVTPQRICGPCLLFVAATNRDRTTLGGLPVSALKQYCANQRIDLSACFDKSDIIDQVIANVAYRNAEAEGRRQQQQQQRQAQPPPQPQPQPSRQQQQQQPQSSRSSSAQQSNSSPRPDPAAPRQPQPVGEAAPSLSPSPVSVSSATIPSTPPPQQQASGGGAHPSGLPSVFFQNFNEYDAPDVDLDSMSVKQLREFLDKYGCDFRDCFDKSELLARAKEVQIDPFYYLIAEDEQCIICMDARASTEFKECGHKNSCKNCAKMLVTKTNVCPTCRARIMRVVDFYHTHNKAATM